MSARAGTLLPSGPVRFALEAAIIVLVGVIAAVLALRPVAILVAMGLAWIVVALVERAAKSTRARPTRPRRHDPLPVENAAEVLREPKPEPEAEPRQRLRFFEPRAAQASPAADGEWNLWELERRAREQAGAEAMPEEWAAMFMHLRQFANSDGRLPPHFDSLVRESFPELIKAG